MKTIGFKNELQQLNEVHSYTLLYIVKYEMKNFILTLDFFLCYNYIKHGNIPLFSMTRDIAAQKQCITKKTVSMYNLFLHTL